MREYAILFRRSSVFACLDDKHKVKVGEPGFPVAAAERGRQVLVHSSTSFEVGNHDFTKTSITPSVSFLVDIPDDITGSWYAGQVHVLFNPLGAMCIYICTQYAYRAELQSQIRLRGKSLPIE